MEEVWPPVRVQVLDLWSVPDLWWVLVAWLERQVAWQVLPGEWPEEWEWGAAQALWQALPEAWGWAVVPEQWLAPGAWVWVVVPVQWQEALVEWGCAAEPALWLAPGERLLA